MPACSFCRNHYEFPRGLTVIQKDSSIKYYCSSKCRKNSTMGRNPKKTSWVRKGEAYKTGTVESETKKKE